ncbi:hypothetical protein D3C87_1927160 [compost metagenome]
MSGRAQADATRGTNDTLRHCLADVIRVTNCHHQIANMRDALRVDGDHGKISGIDFQHR